MNKIRIALYVVLAVFWVVVASQMWDYWTSVDVFTLSSTLLVALVHLLINGVFVGLFRLISTIKE